LLVDRSSSRSTARGGVPQWSLLPEPLGTTRRPCSLAARSTAATCSVSLARAHHFGWTPPIASVSVASRRFSLPAAASRAARAVLDAVTIRIDPPILLLPVGALRVAGRGLPRTAGGWGRLFRGCRCRPGRRRSGRAAW